ncbi:MAG: glucosaminidase domain-containing protein [Cyclobacteriaceae bacterium]|nr:glucosaminidase domain-containing protein [Cyclobacteriaceae bacterium]
MERINVKNRVFWYFKLMTQLTILVVVCSACWEKKKKKYIVKTSMIQVDSLNQIELLKDTLVTPKLYSHLPGLEKVPSEKARNIFISALLPSILVAKYELSQTKLQVEELSEKEIWSTEDSLFFVATKLRFKASDLDDLKKRIGWLPNSIVLAQAAVESAWGQSRFFLQANNVFGIWSYNKNEPRMKAGLIRKNEAKQVHVKVYENFEQAILNYFEILSTANAYKTLREARLETQDPFKLLPHLKNYSEQRTAYTNLLQSVIVRYNLTEYDRYQIHPEYIVAQ